MMVDNGYSQWLVKNGNLTILDIYRLSALGWLWKGLTIGLVGSFADIGSRQCSILVGSSFLSLSLPLPLSLHRHLREFSLWLFSYLYL